jgi:uracil-DNA glycosylase family 4
VVRDRPRRFSADVYWGRAVPGFGDPAARLLIVGLAPAAHGANRTGRMFTGDRSGDWLYETMHRTGFANRPRSVGRDDGLRLHDAYVTAVVHCAPPDNRPRPDEIERCRAYLVDEILRLRRLRVVIVLGQIALNGFLAAWRQAGGAVPWPRPQFGHDRAYRLDDSVTLLTSYHPSQQNTFTGRLTRPMFESVFGRARSLVRVTPRPRSPRTSM